MLRYYSGTIEQEIKTIEDVWWDLDRQMNIQTTESKVQIMRVENI